MTQALYRKWRPQTFDEVVGQEHVTQTLRNALAAGRVGHAYLFAGLRGTGKTTMARLLAKAVNCLADDPADRPCNACEICQAVTEGRFLDLIEIDAASHTGVDDVRELRDKVGFRPNQGRYKVYIIDEVHRFSGSAFDALLKTIEEPPDHAIFVLATTEIHKVPATILSRCQRFDFRRIPLPQIVVRLQQLADAEGVLAEGEALRLIARAATGSLRDAESLLDQLSAAGGGTVTLAQVQATLGVIDTELVVGLVDALVTRDVARGLDLINAAVDQGADLRQLTRQLVDYLRGMLLVQLESDALLDLSPEALEAVRAQAERMGTSALVSVIKRFNEAETELKGGWQPQLPLELALVEAIAASGGDGVGVPPVPVSTPRVEPVSGDVREGRPAPEVVREAPSEPVAVADSQAVAQPAAKPTGDLSLEKVKAQWPQILSAMRARSSNVQALLNSAAPTALEGETVVLSAEHAFAQGKINESANKRLIEEVISKVLGHRCQVTCVVGKADAAQAELQNAASTDALTDDPLVQAARQLGATVRPIDS